MAINASTLNYDPDVPVYAHPDGLEFNAVDTEEQQPVANYIDPATATVEGRVQGILDKNSLLRQSTEADARTTSNQRGILDTTMGVTAGTKGLISQATEIATPDAALYGNAALTQQQADIDSSSNNQLAQLDFDKSMANAKISGALTTQELTGQAEIQKMVDAAQMQRVEVDNQWQELMNFDQLDAADSQALVQTSAALGAELTGSIERLLRDTNVSDKTSAISALMTQYKSQMSTSAAIVNIDLDWS